MEYYIKQSRLADSFYCIADKCPSTCCTGWSVIWSAEEISKLKEVCKGDLLEKCKIAFPCEEKYNAIIMDKDDLCPFLSEGLCEIHRQLGKEYLSYTCRQYPVIIRLINNKFVKSSKTTCYAVVDKLLSDESCMDLVTNKVTEKNIFAMITSEESIADRKITDKLEKILWDNSITLNEALIKCARIMCIAEDGKIAELNEVFRNIFGWDLILCDDNIREDTDRFDNICPNSIRNIIKSLFMEWKISGWSDKLSQTENVCVFIFSAASMMKAYQEAYRSASKRDELICSVNDIAGVLYSNMEIPLMISGYLSENKLMNIDFISYILK